MKKNITQLDMISKESKYNVFLCIDLPDFLNDVPEILRSFTPMINISKNDKLNHFSLKYLLDKNNNALFQIRFLEDVLDYPLPDLYNFLSPSLGEKSEIKKYVKEKLYQYCVTLTGNELPYGSLTGVRPTRIIYAKNGSVSNIKQFLIDNYYVSSDRARLIEEVIINQAGYYAPDPYSVDLFVNIPICKTKCSYCSFGTICLSKIQGFVDRYVECVCKEISYKLKFLDSTKKVKNIYIGGGTPSCIPLPQLEKILSKFSNLSKEEFTVEAGRPDSINLELIKMMRENGVTRISINPQTFSEKTLREIGRSHSISDIYEAFELAKEYSFLINMDLIAGLPGEDLDTFINSLEKTISLKPDNITIHSLSIKKGSNLMNNGYIKNVDGVTKKMVDCSIIMLENSGYLPYYLYRQKNMLDNLENVGYCLPQKQCSYNIDYMEETNSVIGFGAGAMTKYIYFDQNRIERICNKKDIKLYCADMQILDC